MRLFSVSAIGAAMLFGTIGCEYGSDKESSASSTELRAKDTFATADENATCPVVPDHTSLDSANEESSATLPTTETPSTATTETPSTATTATPSTATTATSLPLPVPVLSTSVSTKSLKLQNGGGEVIINVAADGTGEIVENGKVVSKVKNLAVKVNGQWVWNWKKIADMGKFRIGSIAKCIGPLGILMLIGDVTYAGMDYALGDAAAQMGVRQKGCAERMVKAAAGIQCLRAQTGKASCVDATKACPDAFFGASLTQDCGLEPGFDGLVDQLADAIGRTSALRGGTGYDSKQMGPITDGIKSGKFATDPSITCSMRASAAGCTFTSPTIYAAPAGFEEAKKAWEDSDRGLFESKQSEAYKKCTTDACRAIIATWKDC